MKTLEIFLLLAIALYSCTETSQRESETGEKKINATEPKDNIDWKQFQNDMKFVHEDYNLPLGNSVFPVSEYESSGNGNLEKVIQLGDHQYVQQSVFVYQGDYNATFFEGVKDPDQELVFFTLLVKNTHHDSTNQIMSTSRNHPTYLAQGVLTVENKQKIKWLASHNAEEENDMAIVNMKHFDLTKGRLVIVHPMEDGSLRFEQIDVQQESLGELERIIQEEGNSWIGEMKNKEEIQP